MSTVRNFDNAANINSLLVNLILESFVMIEILDCNLREKLMFKSAELSTPYFRFFWFILKTIKHPYESYYGPAQ